MITTPKIQDIIQDLLDTMHAANGAGLAAPQIGIPLQIVVFGFEKNQRYPNEAPVPQTILINPIITPIGLSQENGWEGCLSVPGLRGLVPRFQEIRYQGLNESGQAIDRVVSGFHARVVQHECDHLIGKLYPMRIEDMSQFGFTEVLFPNL
jgi:peptide deformylase